MTLAASTASSRETVPYRLESMEGDERVSMRRFLTASRVRSVGGQMLKEAVEYFSEAAAAVGCDC